MPSDPNMAHFHGLALPLLKRGQPVTPVQLENVTLPGFLDEQRVLLLSYQGQKPLSAEVHSHLAEWVKKGGVLVMVLVLSKKWRGVRTQFECAAVFVPFCHFKMIPSLC